MPETNLAVTYWHIECKEDMLTVAGELLAHGYSGTVSGAIQPTTEDSTPAERWILSLVREISLLVYVGDTVVWNGFAAQVMPRANFDTMVTPGS